MVTPGSKLKGLKRKQAIGRAPFESRVAAILEGIRRIPKGRVQTYGRIDPEAPRLVGLVLATTDEDVPWHRVIRANGTIPKGQRQRELLLREGVAVHRDRVDLKRFRAW